MAEAGGATFEDFREQVMGRAEEQTRNLRTLLQSIESRRDEARQQGRHFTSPTAEQLSAKLRRTNSPMIVFQGWSGGANTPGSVDYEVGINNPDPADRIWLFAHVFVGPANVAPSVDGSVVAVDERFPRLTEPEFAGLTVAAGATESLRFTIAVPAGIEPSNYLGNTILFAATWHDPAEYLDRSLFIFRVS
jgi:hypothetical protein